VDGSGERELSNRQPAMEARVRERAELMEAREGHRKIERFWEGRRGTRYDGNGEAKPWSETGQGAERCGDARGHFARNPLRNAGHPEAVMGRTRSAYVEEARSHANRRGAQDAARERFGRGGFVHGVSKMRSGPTPLAQQAAVGQHPRARMDVGACDAFLKILGGQRGCWPPSPVRGGVAPPIKTTAHP
jgi:hypothetical protein